METRRMGEVQGRIASDGDRIPRVPGDDHDATCIAGEASTVAAIVSGEFVAALEALGRNRPE
jgi:hypothetical protein